MFDEKWPSGNSRANRSGGDNPHRAERHCREDARQHCPTGMLHHASCLHKVQIAFMTSSHLFGCQDQNPVAYSWNDMSCSKCLKSVQMRLQSSTKTRDRDAAFHSSATMQLLYSLKLTLQALSSAARTHTSQRPEARNESAAVAGVGRGVVIPLSGRPAVAAGQSKVDSEETLTLQVMPAGQRSAQTAK